jgi:hypothetical protein
VTPEGSWRPARPGSRRRVIATLVLTAVLTGCADEAPGSIAPTPTRAPEATPVARTFPLGGTVWYEGLLLRFDRATSELTQRGGPVNVALRVENPGTEASDLDAKLILVVGDVRAEATRESAIATVPGGGLVGALLTYELQEIASVEDAVLEVGEAPNHVARVPLADPSAMTTFEPQALDLDRAGNAGDLRIALTSGVVRRDLPDWSQELVEGLLALTLTYDVTYTGSFAGGFAFTAENVAVRLPDKSVVEPRRDGRSQSIELIGAGKKKTDLFSRFEIPSDQPGEYALLVRNGSAERAITFTIGE